MVSTGMTLNRLFLLFVSFGCYLTKELPSDIAKCKAKDVECIAKVATDIIRRSGSGRSDLGIPSYEPFRVDNIILQEANNRPVNLELSLKDIVIHGISGLNVNKFVGFDKDPRTSKFEIYAIAPTLQINGLYKSNGRILVIPVQGEGIFNMTLKDVKISVKFKPTVIDREGKHYLAIDKMKIKIEPDGAKINLDRFLRDGNPLGDSFNDLLNENWRDFWQEIYPSINEAMLTIIKNIIKEPFDMFSYDDIYLPE